MNLDLFDQPGSASPNTYRAAFAAWLQTHSGPGSVRRASSREVYETMWSGFSGWAVGQGITLADIKESDLEAFLHSRGGSDELTPRYAFRLLRLIDEVLQHHSGTNGLPINRAAATVLKSNPDIRYANAADSVPLPDYLPAAEAKRLVTFLSSVRRGRGGGGEPWQDVRNRTAIGLILGAGLTPSDIRALQLDGVVTHGGTLKDVPWKLSLPGNGTLPARETPIARWAGQLLKYWLQVRAEQQIPGSMVFPSTRSSGKPWSRVGPYDATQAVLEAAQIDAADGGSYRLRHTFALRQLRRGKSPADIALWLGVDVEGEVMSRYQRVLMAPVDLA